MKNKTSRLATLLKESARSRPRGSVSGPNQKVVNVLFRNYTQKTVSIYWIDFDGTSHLYYQLLGGHEQPQKTYEGHRWVIRDASTHKLMLEYYVEHEPERKDLSIQNSSHLSVTIHKEQHGKNSSQRQSINKSDSNDKPDKSGNPARPELNIQERIGDMEVKENERTNDNVNHVTKSEPTYQDSAAQNMPMNEKQGESHNIPLDSPTSPIEPPNDSLTFVHNLWNKNMNDIEIIKKIRSETHVVRQNRAQNENIPIEKWDDSANPEEHHPNTKRNSKERNTWENNDQNANNNETNAKVRIVPILELDLSLTCYKNKVRPSISKGSPYKNQIRANSSRVRKVNSLSGRKPTTEKSNSARKPKTIPNSARKRKSVPTARASHPSGRNNIKVKKRKDETSNHIHFFNKNKLVLVKESPYKVAIEKAKTSNEKFEDEYFKPSRKSAGPKSTHDSWKRLSDLFPNCVLFEEVASHQENLSKLEYSEIMKEESNQHTLDNDPGVKVQNPNSSHELQSMKDDYKLESLIEINEEDESDLIDTLDRELPLSPTLDHSRSKYNSYMYSSPRPNHSSLTEEHSNQSFHHDEDDKESIDNIEENPLLREKFCDLRDLSQGSFSLSWLMQAFGAIGSEHMQTLKQIIKGEKEFGVYSVTLHHSGKRIVVLVDDFVPVDSNNICIFTRPFQQKIIWPCILEKAIAKLLGSYSALFSSTDYSRTTKEYNISSVLTAVLGGKSRWMDWGKDDPTGKETQRLIEDHFLWSTLLKKNRVLVITTRQTCGLGLVAHHGYHLLDVMHVEQTKSNKQTGQKQKKSFNLFLIRNSYGKSSWHGAWSQQDKIWNTYPEVKENLYLKDDHEGSLFWMELKDLKKNFEIVWFN